ncbi:MAG: DUF2785 domain-containing protein [Hyphomonadaceae bacterium]
MRALLLLVLAAALSACAHAAAAPAPCPPPGWTREELDGLRAAEFEIAGADERNTFARAVAECLASPDPHLRDRIAFEALTHMLRARQLTNETMTALYERLLPDLTAQEGEGFRRPFAALALSEVARADRIEPFLTQEQRNRLAAAAASYLAGVSDYRGFDEQEGWRHGVAHGADLIVQIGLNERVDRAQLEALLAAVEAQITPAGRFYTYGEPERLARAVLMIARRNIFTEAEWSAFFARVTAPAPLASWEDAFNSQAGLAKRHNTMAFLASVYLNARISGDASLAALLPGAEAGLRGLP